MIQGPLSLRGMEVMSRLIGSSGNEVRPLPRQPMGRGMRPGSRWVHVGEPGGLEFLIVGRGSWVVGARCWRPCRFNARVVSTAATTHEPQDPCLRAGSVGDGPVFGDRTARAPGPGERTYEAEGEFLPFSICGVLSPRAVGCPRTDSGVADGTSVVRRRLRLGSRGRPEGSFSDCGDLSPLCFRGA